MPQLSFILSCYAISRGNASYAVAQTLNFSGHIDIRFAADASRPKRLTISISSWKNIHNYLNMFDGARVNQ